MGWLWATPSPPKTPAPADSAQTPQDAPSNSSTMDPEIQKFLSLLQAETGSTPEDKAAKPTSQPQAAAQATAPASEQSAASSSSTSSWFSLSSSPNSASQIDARDAANPVPKLDPVAESLLPTDMSCRQAFDMAFHCQSVGGQWNAVYRGGGMRSCSEHWDDFWFCMRVKGYTGPMREEAIREHYRKKEWAKYGNGQPSSEDVWRPRTAKVPPGTAFTTRLEEPTVSDEEWQQAELERRRQLRQTLGFDSEQQAAA